MQRRKDERGPLARRLESAAFGADVEGAVFDASAGADVGERDVAYCETCAGVAAIQVAHGLLLRPGTEYTDEQADELLASPQAHHLRQMATYSATGTPDVVRDKVTEFAEQTSADELIIAHQGPRRGAAAAVHRAAV